MEATPSNDMKRMFGDINVFSVPGDDVLTYSKYFLNILADSSLKNRRFGQRQQKSLSG